MAAESSTLVAKRQRTDASGPLVPAAGTAAAGGTLVAGPQRTSDLLAPILLLAGHGAAVHTVKFSPGGELLLSGSHDKTLLLWETFGECKNVLTLKGHANAVVEVHWLGAENAVSASADKLVALWDVKTGGRIRMYKGHTSFVNSCCPAADAPLIVSGGDDSVARVWDTRVRTCQSVLDHPLPVTAVSTSADGKEVYTGCVDGCVRVYDLRKSDGEPKLKLRGHDDIVTGNRPSHPPPAVPAAVHDARPGHVPDASLRHRALARRAAAAEQRYGQHSPLLGRPPLLRGRPLREALPRRAAQLRKGAAQVRVVGGRGARGVWLGGPLRVRVGRGDQADQVQASRPHRVHQRGRLPPHPAHHRLMRKRQARLPRRDPPLGRSRRGRARAETPAAACT
mmetsp:Transcript_2312/g.7723  ORF Transcript_2312/g.7723 Transcript_2312/m.7723 type:complete len:395 (-) Transcript_2312:107-1291(-)